jgi:ribonuclease P protein component
MERLRKRAEFRAVAGGTRVSRPGFLLQALKTGKPGAERPPRYGFTVTKKVGGAVVRNRIRRRLREAVRLASDGEAGMDYVLIGRHAALTLQFDRLIADLRSGLKELSRRQLAANRPPE